MGVGGAGKTMRQWKLPTAKGLVCQMVCRELAGPVAMYGKTLLLFTALLLNIEALCLQVEDEKKVLPQTQSSVTSKPWPSAEKFLNFFYLPQAPSSTAAAP